MTQLPPNLELDSLLIAATRYYIGRCTAAACGHAEGLARDWETLPKNVRAVIRTDLETEFERDDRARSQGSKFRPLGWDCDRRSWEMVREAWQREGAP